MRVSAVTLVVSLSLLCPGLPASQGQTPEGGFDLWRVTLKGEFRYEDSRYDIGTNAASRFAGASNRYSCVSMSVASRLDLQIYDDDRSSAGLYMTPSVKWTRRVEGLAHPDVRPYEYFGAIGVNLMHRPTVATRVELKDSLSYSDDPENGVSEDPLNPNRSRLHNSAELSLAMGLTPFIDAKLIAGSALTRYRDPVLAETTDSDLVNGAIRLPCSLGSGWSTDGAIEVSRYTQASELLDLGYVLLAYNVGVAKSLTSDLTLSAVAGRQMLTYRDERLGKTSSPSGGAGLNYVATEATRLRADVRYGYTPSGIAGYSASKTLKLIGGIEHDIIPRLRARVDGTYQKSQYEQGIADAAAAGDENQKSIGLGCTYSFNRYFSMTLGYSLLQSDSSMRESVVRQAFDTAITASW